MAKPPLLFCPCCISVGPIGPDSILIGCLGASCRVVGPEVGPSRPIGNASSSLSSPRGPRPERPHVARRS
eukprot:4779656-Pyramimonas_sp.AAC.1